jgi:hypothetical protein
VPLQLRGEWRISLSAPASTTSDKLLLKTHHLLSLLLPLNIPVAAARVGCPFVKEEELIQFTWGHLSVQKKEKKKKKEL